MHKTEIAFNNINDHYFNYVHNVLINSRKIEDKIKIFKLRSIIKIKNLLSIIGLINYSVGEVILFKENQNQKLLIR